MNPSEPKSLAEWRSYVAKLSEDALFEQAKAANSLGFIQTLQDEEYSADEIHEIFLAFARALGKTGLRPPADGVYDYFKLIEEAAHRA